MSYRIACIYVEDQSRLKEVRLEVCNEGYSMQIAPFVRKVTVTDLAGDENPLTREFAALLNNVGLEHQPFVLSGDVLHNPDVASILRKNAYSFIQSGNSRSLKRGSIPHGVDGDTLQTGSLLGGTLYILLIINTKTFEFFTVEKFTCCLCSRKFLIS